MKDPYSSVDNVLKSLGLGPYQKKTVNQILSLIQVPELLESLQYYPEKEWNKQIASILMVDIFSEKIVLQLLELAIDNGNKDEGFVQYIADALIRSIDAIKEGKKETKYYSAFYFSTIAFSRIKPPTTKARMIIISSLIKTLNLSLGQTVFCSKVIDNGVIYQEVTNQLISLNSVDRIDDIRLILIEGKKLGAIPFALLIVGEIGDKRDLPLIEKYLEFSCPKFDISQAEIKNSAKLAYDRLEKKSNNNEENGASKGLKTILNRFFQKKQSFKKVTESNIPFSIEEIPQVMNKGIELGKSGKNEKAFTIFNQIITIDPNNAQAYYNRGVALSALGKDNDALQSFEQAITLKLDYSDPWHNKGVILKKMGKITEANQCFEKAFKIERKKEVQKMDIPNRLFSKKREPAPEPILSLSEAFIACETGKYKRARKAYRAIVQANPRQSVAWYNLGVTEFRAGNFAAAAEAFDHVVNLKEHLVLAAYAKALCYKKLGQPLEWPPEYAENPSVLGVEGPIRNLAHELQNRDYVVVVIKAKGEYCVLETVIGKVKYTIHLCDIFGQLSCNVFREEGGKSVSITDPNAYQNPTESDRELISFAGKIGSLPLAQMSVGSVGEIVMPADEYTKLSEAAALKAETQEVGPHGWIRRGQTFDEKARLRQAEMAPIIVRQYINLGDFVAQQPAGNFVVYSLESKAHAIAKVSVEETNLASLRSSVQAGRLILRGSFHSYPEYPLVHVAIFIPLSAPDTKGQVGGTIVECLADFTDANFQEWAVTVRSTRRTIVDVYRTSGEHLASGIVNLDQVVVDGLLKAITEANAALGKISEDRRSFNAAAESFFRDHPKPFLFA